MNITLPVSVAVLLSVSLQAHAAALPTKVLHFGFDEKSGFTLIDALGKGNDAMLIHEAVRSVDVPPTMTPNKTSVLLNGKSHITAPIIDLRNKSFSVSAWVKTQDLATNQTLLSQGDQMRASKGVALRLTTMGGLQFAFTGDHTSTPDGILAPDKQWHHTAFTFDKTTRQRRIYVDGVMQASGTASGVYLGSGITDIGRLNTPPFGADYWNGNIDELSVYDGVLTALDIEALAARDPNASSSSSRRRSTPASVSSSSSSSSSSKISNLIGHRERLALRRALGKRIPLPASSAASSSSSSSRSSSLSRASSVARDVSAPVASTRAASSTPSTVTSPSTLFRVTSYQLRVRLDSRATSKELLTLIKGDTIEVFSFLKNGWARVRTLDGTEGFVHAGFIEQVQ